MLINIFSPHQKTFEADEYESVIAQGLITILTELSNENITHKRYLQLLTALESLLLLMQCNVDLFIERVKKTCPELEGRLALQRFAKIVVARLKAFDKDDQDL